MTDGPDRPSPASAVRGRAITFTGDPFADGDALVEIPDALILTSEGRITAFGPYDQVRRQLPDGLLVRHHPDALICAGFIDAHVHYVQTPMVGAYAPDLIEWLEQYAYPQEERCADPAYAQALAADYLDQLLANGTTTALTFCATYPVSVEALFTQASLRNMRMIAGKVLMDNVRRPGLRDTAQSGYELSKQLIQRWHGQGRNLYAITPRFALTSTPEQLELAGTLWAESPGTFMHTHIAESRREVQLVREMFPERSGYLDVYDHHGLLGRRCLLAHGIHLNEEERGRIAQTGTALAHCPTSNLFLGSGLFSMRAARLRPDPIHVGLGTDIGAGTSFSLLATMGRAYDVGQLDSFSLSAQRLFYLATLGGARALDLDDQIGSIAVGKEANLVVLQPTGSPLLTDRAAAAESVQELMFLLAVLGDDRAVAATYVAGQPAYERPAQPRPAPDPSAASSRVSGK